MEVAAPTREEPLKTTLQPYLWMLAGSCSFAVMGSIAHALGRVCDWQVVAFFRSFLVMAFAAAMARAAGAKLVLRGPPMLWVRSVAGSLSLVSCFYALTRLPVSTTLTLTNTFPIWVAVLSWPMLREVPGARVWLASLFAVAGVAIIQQPQLEGGRLAVGLALAGAVTTAVAMLGLHRLHGIDPRAIVVHFSAVSSAFCVASFFIFDRGTGLEAVFDPATTAMLLGLGLTATAGQVLLTKAFAAGEPAKVSVVGLTQVVFALLLDVFWWQQPVGPETLAGIALVVAPTAWVMAAKG